MYIYICIIFIIAWLLQYLLQHRYSKKFANLVVVSIIFPVCVFAMGLRDASVGIDTVTYKQIFDSYLHTSWLDILTKGSDYDGIEIGLKVFMKCCGCIYPNYYFFQIVFSTTYLFLGFYFIYRYTSCAILGCAVFLGGGMFLQALNIARQMFAVIWIGYFVVCLIEGRIIKSLLFLGISYLFHATALIAAALYILYPIRNMKLIMALIPIIIISIFGLISDRILDIVFTVFGDKYTNYVMNDYSRPNTGIYLKVLWILSVAVALVGYYKPSLSSPAIKILSISVLGAFLCYLLGQSVNYIDRIGYYFFPCIILLYDKVSIRLRRVWGKEIFINMLIVLYMGFFGYMSYINPAIEFTSIID